MKTLMVMVMVKVIIRKIDLDNFQFELLDNDLVKEARDFIKSENNLQRLPHHKE